MGRLRAGAFLRTAALAAASALLLPAGAAASRTQSVFFEPGGPFENPATRAQTVAQMRHLGVRALRIMLYWDAVAPRPNSARKPHFAASDPASYNWSAYLPALEEAKRLHWPVLMTVTSPVPKWASAGHRDHLTRPNDKDFREFMTAAGRELGPYVSLWAIWNEPNQLGWLQPQWNRNGSPASPAIYRGLFLAGYGGLRAAGIGSPKVLMGETAPFGNSSVNARREGTFHQMAPLTFLRGVLCLDGAYHRVGRCGRLPAYGYAHHAYTNSAGPFYVPPNPDEVTIGTLGRLVRALNLAARAGAIRPNMGIYLTEFGINMKPNVLGVSPFEQAVQDAIAEHIAWENPRVDAFSQYELQDDAIPRHHPRGWIGFQTGLESARGARMPLYWSFPVPLVVRAERNGSYYIWGHIRPARGPTSAQVLIKHTRGDPYTLLARVRTGPLGYFVLRSRVPGRFWKIRWIGPRGVRYEGFPMPAS
jgi:hypothetical protein